MLQRTVTYSTLLRLLGACFFVYGLYVIVLALTAQSQGYNGDGTYFSGPMMTYNPMLLESYLFNGGVLLGNPVLPGTYHVANVFGSLTPGPLLWVGLGTLCVCLTTRRMLVVYLGLQIALWVVSVSLWNPILWLQGSHQYGLDVMGPLALITLAVSLVLLTLYKPVTSGLGVLVAPRDIRATTPNGRTSGHLAPS